MHRVVTAISGVPWPSLDREMYQMLAIPTRLTFSLAVLVTIACCGHSAAEVTRFEVTKREPYAGGKSFGDVGQYDRIQGRVYFEIDPELEANQAIVDLGFAPRNSSGMVEFHSELDVLAPRDLSMASGAALYDVNNRGNKLALHFFNDGAGGNDPPDVGHGFLMRHGWIVVWSGWDGELLPGNGRLQLSAPLARDAGNPITGPVRYEIFTGDGETQVGVNRGGHGAYRPTERGLQDATLTWRQRPHDPRVTIPRDQFRLHVIEVASEHQGQLPRIEIELPSGFQPGYLYELIYEAQDPLVHGVCFASVRDLMTAFKHGTGRSNPLLHQGHRVVKRMHGFGVSQSGRFLREFLYSGFNADELGRQVFDGLIPHVSGGGLGSFNHRFAQPTAFNTQQEYHDWPSDRFPFAYSMQTDPFTGQSDGIMRRAEADGVAPRVLHTQSAAEYWTRSGSLVHTDPQGQSDATIPENVRVYGFGGTQHGPASWPTSKGDGQTLANPGDYRPFLRALLSSLDDWANGGKSAPSSVYPKIADGTLVNWQQESTGFPALPGVRYPEVIHQPSCLDLGPSWLVERIPTVQPPRTLGDYTVLAAKTDSDGNELGCLLPPEVVVPTATYTGWNLRDGSRGSQNQLVKLVGSYIPFLVRRFDRIQVGDPRRSVEERYSTLEAYAQQLREACDKLLAQRYLLEEDVSRIVSTHTQRCESLFERISGERVRALAVEARMVSRQGAGEGPAWHPKLGLLTSGDGSIHRHDRNGETTVHEEGAGTNGLLYDRQGRLVRCESRARRVTRVEPDGAITVLTDGYAGSRYNNPNDLTIDSKGRIYFSDPRYGSREGMEMLDEEGREIEGVYRIDPSGSVTRVITHEVDRPNGVLVTPDDRYIYVADNNNNTIGSARVLWRFDLQSDGTISFASKKKIYDWQTGRGPDGMALDVDGNLYVAGGLTEDNPPFETAVKHLGGVYVFDPSGGLIDFVAVPRDEVTNCAFGGEDLQTLFVTAGGTLWTIRTTRPGAVLWP
jgi:sugar lactone lactonase YvrE